ncbi:transcriptional regulator [Glutamicibacter sp. NPDC087344]|uniref:transcriptional regulator n=1 Tax=Glutamicibacter sp. NPDC087344 TaxID=3363994 RepID=UPI0037F96ED9
MALTLKVLQEPGFEEPATKQIPDRSDDIARAFQQTLATEDYEYALRLVSEYAAESLEAGQPLLRKAPELGDKQYIVALAALTRWVAAKTQSVTPSWALNVSPSAQPVFLSDKIYPVGKRMKALIRAETPAELKRLNVWMRERSLATV